MFQVLFLIFKIHDDTKNGKKKVRVAQNKRARTLDIETEDHGNQHEHERINQNDQ